MCKRIILPLIIASALIPFIGYAEDNHQSPEVYGDSLSREEVLFLDSIGIDIDEYWSLDEMMGLNGKTLAKECADNYRKLYNADKPNTISAQECIDLREHIKKSR